MKMLMQSAVLKSHVDEHFNVGDNLCETENGKAEMAGSDGLEECRRPEMKRCEWHWENRPGYLPKIHRSAWMARPNVARAKIAITAIRPPTIAATKSRSRSAGGRAVPACLRCRS